MDTGHQSSGAKNDPSVFTNMEKAPTRRPFIFKTVLRHYAIKQVPKHSK